MKIIVAMDSFKGSCTAFEAGEAVCKGINKVLPSAKTVNIPVADGGEGTVDAVVGSGRGKVKKCKVTGPLGKEVVAEYGLLENGTAVMEMSSASGLLLVPQDKLNPLITTTYGTGELIKAILDDGYRSILIGLGGSATNDGGVGMMQALGVSFKDKKGHELGFGGGNLINLDTIDTSNIDMRLKECHITIASDVSNPLCGENGASSVYGPQKGATPEMVDELDKSLEHYGEVIKKQIGADVIDIPGAGAAGGIGAAFHTFFEVEFKSGIEAILKMIDFDAEIKGADLVITGEGRIDEQTAYGKVPVGVAEHAKKVGDIPVIALGGSIENGAEAVYENGISAMFSIANGPITLHESMQRAEELLTNRSEAVVRTLFAGQKFDMALEQ